MLGPMGIPCGPINTIPQVVTDPQVRERGMIREVSHPRAGTIPIANTPFRLSRSEAGIKGSPPDLGADTVAVLGEMLGITAGEVAELEERGVVATSGGPDIGAITG